MCPCLRFLICKMGLLTSTSQGSLERKASPGTDVAVMCKLHKECLRKQMFPGGLEATGMDSGGEHKGNWHALAIYTSLVARDLCICDLGVMQRNQGTVGSRPPWEGGA